MNKDGRIFKKFSRLNPTCKMKNALWPCVIYSRNSSLAQHLEISIVYHINRLNKKNCMILWRDAKKKHLQNSTFMIFLKLSITNIRGFICVLKKINKNLVHPIWGKINLKKGAWKKNPTHLEVIDSLIAIEMTIICYSEDWPVWLYKRTIRLGPLEQLRFAWPDSGFPSKTAPAVQHPYSYPIKETTLLKWQRDNEWGGVVACDMVLVSPRDGIHYSSMHLFLS